MTEIFNGYFFMFLIIALALVGAVYHIIDLETRSGYRPSKASARALRDVEKLLKEANE